MKNKLKTKALALILALILGTLLSIALAWVLLQIFTKNPTNILNFNPIIMFSVFSLEEGIQMFIIILICFLILMAISTFKIFNLDDYLSKTYKVTKEIRIPLPVGKEQTQQGSSWFLPKRDFSKVFGINTFDPSNSTVANLLTQAKIKRDIEEQQINEVQKFLKEASKNDFDDDKTEKFVRENVDFNTTFDKEKVKPIYKSGGLVVGKRDRTVFSPSITKLLGKIPIITLSTRRVEDIYYVKDDMHSLTVGSTRSGKTRNLVLQTISNTGLAGENMIISDPKGELYEYTSQMLKNLGYNVLTLDFKTPNKSSKYNFLQPVIEQVEKGDIPKAQNRCSDIAESLVGDVGNREAIWVNGEKAVIKTGIMAVVIENSKDIITDKKINILKDNFINLHEEKFKSNYKKEYLDEGIEDVSFEEYLEDVDLESIKIEYRNLSLKEKDILRESWFEPFLNEFYSFIDKYLTDNYYFLSLLQNEKEKNLSNLRDELYYNFDKLYQEFKNTEIENTEDKEIMNIKLEEWKELNDNRTHPEFMNIPNVYNFLATMCIEQEDKTMLIDTFLEELKNENPNHPAIHQFQAAKIAATKTRSSFFSSALTTLNVFIDDYIANMINSSDIDINKFNKERTALFMILPDEKTTFYGLCSLFVNQTYQKLVEMADSKGGRLNIRTNFILDEFGNFSAIPNFGGFLTVGGGRGVRFNLFIQSFSQLNDKYGDNTAKNILDNCHVWNYLKTSNFETADMVSKKLRNIYLFYLVHI